MKKKKILSMALIACSITLAVTGTLSVVGFTGKGKAVAATITATGTATDTATDTPYYPSYIPVSDTTVEKSLDFGAIQNKSQTVIIDYPQVNQLSVEFPQAFVNADKLSGLFWIDLAYDNFNYSKYYYTKYDTNLLKCNGYKVLDKVYDLMLIGSSFNGDQSVVNYFDKPVSVTISLTDSQLSGFDKSKLKVFSVDWNDNIKEMPTTVNGNNVTFTTTYFTTFYIGQVQDTSSTTNTTNTSSTTSAVNATKGVKTSDSNNIIGLIVLAVGSIIVGTTVVGIKKKNKGLN